MMAPKQAPSKEVEEQVKKAALDMLRKPKEFGSIVCGDGVKRAR